MKVSARRGMLVTLFLVTVIAAPAQTFTTLVIFDNTNGATPETDVVQGRDGNLYGTTVAGGANSSACNGHGCGTIFKMTPGGALTSVYSFCAESGCPDGAVPYTGLIQATDGNFYGTTAGGGAYGDGTAFKMTAAGKLTTLTSFVHYIGIPSGLIQASDGSFYWDHFSGR